MFKFSISFKLSVAIVSIMAGALLIISYLNYCNFAKDLQSFVTSRFEVLSKDITGTIEYGLNLGLGLGELRTVQEIIEEKANGQDIESILVTNNQGKVLFQSDPAKLQANRAFSWYQLFKSNNIIGTMSAVTVEDKDNYILVSPLVNNFNVRVGSFVLIYPKAVIDKPQRDMVVFLIWRFVIVFVGFSGVAFWVTRLFFKHFFTRNLGVLEDSLQAILSGHSEVADSELKISPDLKVPFISFREKVRRLLASLNAEADSANLRGSENGR